MEVEKHTLLFRVTSQVWHCNMGGGVCCVKYRESAYPRRLAGIEHQEICRIVFVQLGIPTVVILQVITIIKTRHKAFTIATQGMQPTLPYHLTILVC